MFFLSRMLLNVRRDSRSGRIYVFFQSVTAVPVAGTLPQKGLMQIKDWGKIIQKKLKKIPPAVPLKRP
jgi:hypothetical protein